MEITVTCNCKKFIDHKFQECGKSAKWKHPRYPDGKFCNGCKEDISSFFPNDWSLLEED